MSGIQARTLKHTQSSFADYKLFFNRGLLSNYRTSYQKAEFYQTRLQKSFPYIYGSPNLQCFIFGSLDAGFDITWLVCPQIVPPRLSPLAYMLYDASSIGCAFYCWECGRPNSLINAAPATSLMLVLRHGFEPL